MGTCCSSETNSNRQGLISDGSSNKKHRAHYNPTPINISISKKYRVEYLNADALAYEIGFQASPMTAETAYWDGIRRVSMNILNQMIFPTNDNNKKEWEKKNVFISSFSISAAFALVFAGIDKDSESCKQIASVLNYPTMMQNMDTPINVSKMIIEEQLSLINKLNPPAMRMYTAGDDGDYKERDVTFLQFKMGNYIFYNDKFNFNTSKYEQLFDVVGEKALQNKDKDKDNENKSGDEKENSNGDGGSMKDNNGLKKLDFGDAENAAGEINTWVSSMTDDKIQSIVNSNDFMDPNTMAIMVNAIYLKSRWYDTFDKDSTRNEQKFYKNVLRQNNKNGILSNNLDLMVKTKSIYSYKYFVGFNPQKSNFEFLKIPFECNNNDWEMYMLVALSTKNNVDYGNCKLDHDTPELMQAINMFSVGNKANYKKYLKGIVKDYDRVEEFDVRLYLPKIMFRTDVSNMKDILKELGIKDVFNEQDAVMKNDLKGMENENDNGGDGDNGDSGGLFISKVAHKTFFAMNETGIEAAAVTAATLSRAGLCGDVGEPLERRIVFCADFPFYFFIIHSEKVNQDEVANKMLFMGKVNTIDDSNDNESANLL